MKLGLVAGYSPAHMSVPLDLILEAERLGFDSVWMSEAWGSDAVTPAAWILARTSFAAARPAAHDPATPRSPFSAHYPSSSQRPRE